MHSSPRLLALTLLTLAIHGAVPHASGRVDFDASQAPTAILDAPERVNISDATFTLSGERSSDADGSIVLYRWTSLDGSIGILAENQPIVTNTPTLTVTPTPESPFVAGSYTLRLVVVDDAGDESLPVLAEVIVIDDVAPTAVLDAPHTVSAQAPSFVISGEQSFDIGGTVVRYLWTSLNGTLGNLLQDQPVETGSPTFTVTAPPSGFQPGFYVIELVVVDSSGNQSVAVTASVGVTDDQVPTAVLAAPDRVSVTEPSFVLSGAQSFDVDGSVQQYIWTSLTAPIGNLPAGQEVVTGVPSLTVTASPAAPFQVGLFRFQLVVVDDAGNHSLPVQANVIIVDEQAPTAVLDVPPPVSVTAPSFALSGAQSVDVGGTVVQYIWTSLTASIGNLPAGQDVVTDVPTLTVTASPAAPFQVGLFRFQLVVVDSSGNHSQPVQANVIIVDDQAPTAVIQGPDRVSVTAPSFVLSGAQSFDVGGTVRRYIWRSLDASIGNLTAGQDVVTDVPTLTVVASPAAPFPVGRFTFQLVVEDDAANRSQPALRDVIIADDQAPTAVLDVPPPVSVTAPSFVLSGAQSVDVGGTVVQYIWTSLTASIGNLLIGQDVVTDVPTLSVTATPAAPFQVGVFRFQLVVVDSSGNHSQPVQANVIIVDNQAPTAVLDVPPPVSVTAPGFTLSGARSADSDGTIRRYIWTSLTASFGTIMVNVPIETDAPSLTVPGPFQIGQFAWRLVVVDDAGNESTPVVAEVTIVDDQAPTAVLDAPQQIGMTAPSFTLSGGQSFDIGGAVRRYIWSSPTGIGNLLANVPIETDAPTFTVLPTPTHPFQPGVHIVQLEVVDDSDNRSQPVQHQVIVVDDVAPTIVISSPTNGATYHVGQLVAAAFSCADAGSGIALCNGTVPSGSNVDTATPGPKTFAVIARDAAGNESQLAVDYTVSFKIAVLYDQNKAAKSGSTIPIKIRLEDANGANISSPDIVVTAIGVTQLSTSATSDVADPGNANPDSNFRLTTDGHYQFNLKTTGLGTGTYVLSFRCGSDPTTHTVGFQIR